MTFACTADFADWYDTVARNYADKALTDFVDQNPGLIGVYVAGTAGTAFDLSSVLFVDLLRFGSGAGSGTAGGVFSDVLRALSVIPVGRVAATVGRVGRPMVGTILNGLDRLYWAGLRGKLCVPISVGQALQRTGQALVVRLDDVLKGMGRDLASFDRATGHGASIEETRAALAALKAQFTELPARSAATFADVIDFARGTEGVLMVSLKRQIGQATGRARDSFHRVLVSNTADGVVIIDRKGVFRSLEELSRRYGSTGPAEFYTLNPNRPLFAITNWMMDPALVGRLDRMGVLGAIVVKAAMTLGFSPAVPRAAVEARFARYAAAKSPEELYPKPVMPPPMAASMHLHEVGARIERKDWLSVIAERWYGDQLLWPIIFDFNKSADFPHPRKMKPHMRIKVPFPPTLSKAEKAVIHRRALDWR